MNRTRYSQRGVTLTGLVFWGILIALVAVLGMKVAPHVVEYYKIKKAMVAVAGDGSATGTVASARLAFDRRANVDSIDSIKGSDIEVSKEGNMVVLSIAYSRQIPLFGPVSLLIDFEAASNR